MFGKIAAFELRYQLRQPVFYVVTLIFLLLGFGLVATENVSLGSGGNVHKNAPVAVAQAHLFFNLFFMLATTAFVANVILRDDATGYAPILRSTRVRKFDYVLGRFTGAFGSVLICFLSVSAGMLLGSLAPWVDPETLGPIRLGDFAYNYLLFGVPGLLLTSSLFFMLATVTRSMMASYLGAVAVLVLYFIGIAMLGRLGSETVAALMEPFGLGAFFQETEYWTPAERNTRNVPLSGLILANRAIWIGVSLGLLATAYALFRFEARGKPARRKEKVASLEQAPAAPVAAGPLPQPTFGSQAAWATLVKRTRFEMAHVFKSPAFAILLLLGVLNAGFTLWFADELLGTPIYPTTRTMIAGLEDAFIVILLIIATFYAGELVWRERERRVHEITDSTAVPDWAFIVPKTLAITLVLAAVLVVGVLTGVAVQAGKGFYDFEFDKYLRWFILPGLVTAFTLSALVVFVQALAPHKFVGWGVMLLYLIATGVLSSLGFDHNLYLYGSAPPTPLSDINGQGDFARFAGWFNAYWSAFAVVLLVIAYGLWRRGTESRFRPRLRRMPAKLAGPSGAIGALALATFAGLGAWIFVNTNVWNEYRSHTQWERWTAEREKALLRYEDVPQPSVTDVVLDLDLDPHAPRLTARGTYVLENKTGAPLSQVHLRWMDTDLKVPVLQVEGARLTRAYDDYMYRIFTFQQPLAPGERRTVRFTTELAQRGFKNSGNTTRLVDNGTFIENREFTPVVGMDRRGVLQDRAKRRKFGLPPELRMAKLEDQAARRFNYFRTDWVNADITLTTVADQTPIAPGYKVSETVRDGRRTARFRTDAPIHHFFSVQSAKYAVHQQTYKGVNLAIYHHPGHDWNVDQMLNALRVSLDYYTESFGPYQFRQARIVEAPDYLSFAAQAFANTMPYSEGQGFGTNLKGPKSIDYVSMITAHELAHQWWGHQLIGADAQGSTMLSETLAEYSALVVLEKMYGHDRIRRLLKSNLDQYLAGRSSEAIEELPLLRVENQGYIHYRKGGLVLYLLRDKMGEAAVNRALRRVLEAHRFSDAPFPTSLDLVRALRAEAGPEHQPLITDLVERITLYDFTATEMTTRKRPDGRWDVTLTVQAEKLHADGQGEERPAPLNEVVDVGVFASDPEGKTFDRGDVLLFEQRPVRTGTQRWTFVTARRPTHAGVDPYNKWIDRDSGDNVRKVG
jgi:aminopeptidase N